MDMIEFVESGALSVVPEFSAATILSFAATWLVVGLGSGSRSEVPVVTTVRM